MPIPLTAMTVIVAATLAGAFAAAAQGATPADVLKDLAPTGKLRKTSLRT